MMDEFPGTNDIPLVEIKDREPTMSTLTRAQWGFKGPLGPKISYPVARLWLHHTVTAASDDPAADARRVEQIGIGRFGRGSYSDLVHPDGTHLELQSGHVGAHTAKQNSTSEAISCIGNYDVAHPPQKMLDTIAQLVQLRISQGRWPATGITGAHRDAPGAATACAGKFLNPHIPALNKGAAEAVAPDWIAVGDNGPHVVSWQRDLMLWDTAALPTFGADGDFGAETLEWTLKFLDSVGLGPADRDKPRIGQVSRDAMDNVLKGEDDTTPDQTAGHVWRVTVDGVQVGAFAKHEGVVSTVSAHLGSGATMDLRRVDL